MRLFGWFRFPLICRANAPRPRKHLRRRIGNDWQLPGGPVAGIVSLEERRLLSVTLSVSNPLPIAEGTTGSMVFVVTRGGDTSSDVQVAFQTVDGTAKAGIDYTATSGKLDFTSGTTSLAVSVPMLGSTGFATDRTFTLQLSELPTFAVQQTFATGSHPGSVITADLNGDGLKDVIIGDRQAGTVSVLMNTTAPGATAASFAAQETFATGAYPNSVVAADINGDGLPDLIVADQDTSGAVSVLLNTTAPGATAASFAAQTTFAVGSKPASVNAVDLNGDGLKDLAVANYKSSSVSVLINTTAAGATAASFTAQQTFTTGPYSVSVSTADINGDGLPDLVVASNTTYRVSVLLNATIVGTTTASFAAQQTFLAGTSPVAVTTADVNGDGLSDLVVANFNSDSLSVLLNTTAPGATLASFAGQQTFATGTHPGFVTTADVNGDGRPDLVVTDDGSTTVSVLDNMTAPGSTTASFAAQQTFTVSTNTYGVAVADLNGDGYADLLVCNYKAGNVVSVLLNTTARLAVAPSLSAATTFAAGTNPVSVAVGDLNGDGKADLVVANSASSTVSVFLNTTVPGATAASFAAQQTFTTAANPTGVAIADLNEDGFADLVVANDNVSGSVSVLLNSSVGGSSTVSFTTQQTFATGANPDAVTTADLNGDGHADLIVANASGSVSVLLNAMAAGATSASFAAQQTFAAGTTPASVTTADVNGDGRADVIVANKGSAAVSVLLNTTAAGAASASFATQETFGTGANPAFVAAADLNGDGRADLVIANDNASGSVSVLLNTTAAGAGSASFTAQQTIATGANPTSIVVADLTGDESKDLIVANSGGGSVSVLANTTVAGSATASFAAQATFGASTNPVAIVEADLNGDGAVDLLVANNNAGGSVSALLDTAAAISGNPATGTIQVTAAFSFTGEYGVTGGSSSLASITQNGSSLTLNGSSTISATITSGTQILVNGTDTATYSKSSIIFTSGTFAGQTWTKLDLPPDYTNQQGATTHVIQNGSALTFVNRIGRTSPGTWLSPTQLNASGWNENVTIIHGALVFEDGSIWSENLNLSGNKNGSGTTTVTATPSELSVIDYVNGSGKPVHLVLSGTATFVFIDSNGHMSLGTFINATQATTPAFPGDVATISGDLSGVSWTDGTIWTRTVPKSTVTVTNYTNQNGVAVHLVQNGTSQVVFVDGAGRFSLGTMQSANTALSDAFPGDLATISASTVSWQDGSLWTKTNTAGSSPIVVTDYVNGSGKPVHLIENGTSNVIFIDGNSHMSLGTFTDSTHATTPAFPGDVATIASDLSTVTWQDGSVWTKTTATTAITVTSYKNTSNVGVYLVQNGTSQLGFVDGRNRLSLGTMQSPTIAQANAFPGDLATIAGNAVYWQDGSVWIKTTASSLMTSFFDTNGARSHVQVTSATTLVGLDGSLRGLTGTRVDNQIDWSNGAVWNNFDLDVLNALFEMATGYP